MKLSRGDFFKLVGGGAGAAAIVSQSKGELTTVDSAIDKKTAVDLATTTAMAKGRAGGPQWFEVISDALYARFTGTDLRDTRFSVFMKNFGSPEAFHPANNNIAASGSLPVPEIMIVNSISVILDADVSDRDFAAFGRSVAGTFQITNRIFNELPMARLAVRARLDDFKKHDRFDNDVQGPFRLEPPLIIDQGAYFKYDLTRLAGYRAPETLGGYVFLNGAHVRAIQ